MRLSEIYNKGKLSVRSYHICSVNDINTIEELIMFFTKYKTFKKFRNCGRKSDEELINLCNNYYLEENDIFNSEIKENILENPLKKIILELTRVQRDVINSFILVNTNSLSVRSENAISLHLKNNLKVKNFTDKLLLSNNFNAKNINNIGAKCVPEIENYISIIKNFLIEVSQSDNEKYLISLKNNFLIQRTFSISKIPNEILETESIFLLTDFLLNSNILFKETYTIIITKGLRIYEDEKKNSLKDISEIVNLTRERVRQIREKSLTKLFDKLLFIKNFNEDLFQKYNIDISSNQIEINIDLVNIINTKNKTNFSREFITYLLYIYLSNNFLLVGNIKDVIRPTFIKFPKRHYWVNLFLIKKELVTEFYFNTFINDIYVRVIDKIEESYSFSFKSYLSNFLINDKIEFLDVLFPIAENIVNEEFQLYLDLDENIIFKRNTFKSRHEYSYEALESLGVPSKVKDIFEKILELYPNFKTDEKKVRTTLKRSKGFLPIGKTSVFGLKKWENELEDFKGGTIRCIIYEFLLNFDEPLHMKEIENHVKQFRPKTSSRSIYANLTLDESDTFVFYENKHIGLTSKKYSVKYKKDNKVSKQRQTWEESFQNLKDFIDQKKRLPTGSTINPENEKRLWRWLNIQKIKCSTRELEREKDQLVTEIVNKDY